MSDIYDDGDYRKSKSKITNVLLVRTPMGRAKPSAYDLPPETFVFGRKNAQDEEGVPDVVGSWQIHLPSPPEPAGHAVRSPKSVARAIGPSASANTLLSPVAAATAAAAAASASLMVGRGKSHNELDAMVFGRPSRPSTPIHAVLTNAYQREWIEAKRREDNKKKEEKKEKETKVRSLHTRASLGHTKVHLEETQERFIMARFKDVPGRTATFDRQRASLAATVANPVVTANNATAHHDEEHKEAMVAPGSAPSSSIYHQAFAQTQQQQAHESSPSSQQHKPSTHRSSSLSSTGAHYHLPAL